MSLKEYRQKRDFSRSREPRGREEAASGHLFVVHKHAARRLHYDLRLEFDGVLKSWAVPRGPSLDPTQKRLAVQVEDHPLEYGAFEGTIPAGEYGGGTVMLWDRGTWEPEGDPREGLQNGKLSFRLHGEKLRGSWALARMRARGGEVTNNWLLIKHRDSESVAEAGSRIITAQPFSVATGRSMDDIRIGAGAHAGPATEAGPPLEPGQLTNSRQAPPPTKIKPQLATLVAEPPAGEEWLHEIKFDGYRILATIAAGRITLRSRHDKDWSKKFPRVVEALGALPVKQAILDGEIVVPRPDGTSDFQALQDVLQSGGQTGRLVYYLFDLPWCDGYDLTAAPLRERKELLRSLVSRLAPASEIIRFSDHLRGSGPAVWGQACLLAAEGIVSKAAEAGYEQGRSRRWLKSKCLRRQELVVCGWSEPGGSRLGFGALLLGYFDQGELVYAGRVGTGFTQSTLRQLSGMLNRIEQPGPPFARPPVGAETRGVHWVKPVLVAEVAFREWTNDNLLRQAVFKGLREDKAPERIGREAPVTLEGGAASARPASRPGAAVVIAGVRLTHPDKVLFPGQGVTKRMLAEFYQGIAEFILPHVIHRPLTLLRCPEGHQSECFYQKHLKEAMPEALRAIPIQEKNVTEEYPVIDDLAGLISLVQLGVLEIHPWGCREPAIEQPDRLTFDLDPGPGIGWPRVIEGARLVGRRLEEIGLRSFVKTSGGKGLHVVVPLEPLGGWEPARAFARAVALDLARLRPELFVATMSKAKRQGRIFVDYLRNNRGATAVAAYSTRARPGAPVSTPLGWDELDTHLTPDRYRLDNLARRLSTMKSDPWQDFFGVRQGLPGW